MAQVPDLTFDKLVFHPKRPKWLNVWECAYSCDNGCILYISTGDMLNCRRKDECLTKDPVTPEDFETFCLSAFRAKDSKLISLLYDGKFRGHLRQISREDVLNAIQKVSSIKPYVVDYSDENIFVRLS
jgi:hypothetical protein